MNIWQMKQSAYAEKEAQAQRKLLVCRYNAATEQETLAVMDRIEYETEKAVCRTANSGDWVYIMEDYTATVSAAYLYAYL